MAHSQLSILLSAQFSFPLQSEREGGISMLHPTPSSRSERGHFNAFNLLNFVKARKIFQFPLLLLGRQDFFPCDRPCFTPLGHTRATGPTGCLISSLDDICWHGFPRFSQVQSHFALVLKSMKAGPMSKHTVTARKARQPYRFTSLCPHTGPRFRNPPRDQIAPFCPGLVS